MKRVNNKIFTVEDLMYSDIDIQGFFEKIRETGFVEIENAFYPWVIDEAKNYVKVRNEEIDSGYLSLRAEDMEPCIFIDIKESKAFKDFLERLLTYGRLRKPNNKKIHCVLRSITGGSNVNTKASEKYHFDAYDLTVSMPIVIPDENEVNSGDFIIFERRRSTSHGLIKTLIYKCIFQNKYFRCIASSDFFFRLFRGNVIKTKPGSMYIFLGFRTYHGNKKITPGLSRATALFHYGNPLEDSVVIREIEMRRRRPQD
jgi:hypothetical protein